jgi:hypothetical protein
MMQQSPLLLPLGLVQGWCCCSLVPLLSRLCGFNHRIGRFVGRDNRRSPQRVGNIHYLGRLTSKVVTGNERVLRGNLRPDNRAVAVVINSGRNEQRVVLVYLHCDDINWYDHWMVGLGV